MFTLAISCLTMSNLPWFMDLTLYIPMQCCSLLHQPLLSLPDTSIVQCHFHFGPAPSFFLDVLVVALCSSTVEHWMPYDLGVMSYFFAFSYCLWGSCSKNTGVGWHFLLQGTMFCQNSSLCSICSISFERFWTFLKYIYVYIYIYQYINYLIINSLLTYIKTIYIFTCFGCFPAGWTHYASHVTILRTELLALSIHMLGWPFWHSS